MDRLPLGGLNPNTLHQRAHSPIALSPDLSPNLEPFTISPTNENTRNFGRPVEKFDKKKPGPKRGNLKWKRMANSNSSLPRKLPPKTKHKFETREYKINVIMYYECTVIRNSWNKKKKIYEDRKPYYKEVCEYYNNAFKPTTLAGWIQGQEKIFNSTYGSRAPRNWNPEWPELEEELFCRFHQQREGNKLVGRGWFERESRKIWPKIYPHLPDIFTFSNGWFQRFLQRYGISLRRLTKQVTSCVSIY